VLLHGLALSLIAAGAEPGDLQGVYILDRAASDNIDIAIDKGIGGMNFVIKPLARSRIARTNPLYERVEISRDDFNLQVRFDANKPIEMPLDGRSVPWVRQDGGTYDVTVQQIDSRLMMHFNANDGQRSNTFTLDPDGSRLRLDVVLTSQHLPRPINYVLVFHRQAH
jgi:hypothetical protein